MTSEGCWGIIWSKDERRIMESNTGGYINRDGCKFEQTNADVWMRPATKPNGFEYYEYLLVYVDDILAISHNPKPLIDEVGKAYELKKGSVGPPTRYLGATISKFQIPGDKTGREYWVMSA